MIDIEAAFLEADLDEDIFIEIPEGLVELGYFKREEVDDKCIKLGKAMYGCMQSPRAFFKTLSKHLVQIGMIQSKVDPCIWYRLNEKNELVLVMAAYVDDIIIGGQPEEVNQFKNDVKKRFNISELGQLKKHRGVWYERKEDNLGLYYEMTMEKYKTEIVQDYEGISGKQISAYETPGYPGESLTKIGEDEEPVNVDGYWKILGKVLWYTRKVLPECANATRELSMYMDKPGEAQWRGLHRLVGYIGSSESCLRLRAPRDLKIFGFVDSNYATNKDNRKSVTGYVLTVGGSLIAWMSKTQPSVTLSSCEAEYVALSTCATEVKLVQTLFEELLPEEGIRPATY